MEGTQHRVLVGCEHDRTRSAEAGVGEPRDGAFDGGAPPDVGRAPRDGPENVGRYGLRDAASAKSASRRADPAAGWRTIAPSAAADGAPVSVPGWPEPNACAAP